MSPDRSASALLLDLLAHPGHATGMTITQWDGLLRVARKEKVLSRLGAVLAADPTALAACPEVARAMFRAARAYPDQVQARARWEVHKLLAATEPLGIEFILLKGVGYAYAGLPVSHARAFADVDVLVRESVLSSVEGCLLDHGWESGQTDAYDLRYYRQWMHEIPPLRRPGCPIEVDIHHRILPRTSRLSPNPERLWDAAVPVGRRLRVLAPPDMVLHSAAHLFYGGEIRGEFRGLLDLHQLLVHFGAQEASFWDVLLERARLLELLRPLHYALHFCDNLLTTPIPGRVLNRCRAGAPGPVVGALMDRLVCNVLPPRDIGKRAPVMSAWLLYVRSHWLRMPPWLLTKHLIRKALRRLPRFVSAASGAP